MLHLVSGLFFVSILLLALAGIAGMIRAEWARVVEVISGREPRLAHTVARTAEVRRPLPPRDRLRTPRYAAA